MNKSSITLCTPAKINLTLDILEKDASGYHEIRSIVMPIGLFDAIKIQVKKTSGIQLKTSGLSCPKGQENIVYRAAELFFHEAGILPNIIISLIKNIPLTAGLGGGSSNAAATLLALNKLYDTKLSAKKLHFLALQLGTEVPYFLNPRLALITHFGEKITPIKRQASSLPDVTLLIPKTKKASTKNQYESLDLAQCGKGKSSTAKLLKYLKTSQKVWDPSWDKLLHNDFDQLYKENLKEHLSGSGPTQFVIHPII